MTRKDGTPVSSLTAAWKRCVQRIAFATTLATTACTPARKADMDTGDRKPVTADTIEPSAAEPPPVQIDLGEQVILSAKEEARRDRIRATLLKQAQKEYLKLAGISSPEGYSQQLRAVQESLSARLATEGGRVHSRAVMLEPEKFDIGVALGFSAPDALRKMLVEQGVKPDAAMIKSLTPKIGAPAGETFIQNPVALTNLSRLEPTVCIVVPSSEHARVVDIRGLTPMQQVEFANRHESWHCLDTKYTLHDMDPKEAAKPMKGSLADNVGNKTVLEKYANAYKKEALADVGAIGDMIRSGGYGIDLVGKIIDWRNRYPNEVDHLSSPVLKGFQAKIEEMGIDAFRKLDDNRAKALYFAVTDQYGMTAKSIEYNLRIEKLGVPGRIALVEKNAEDPELTRALDFMGYYFNKPVDRGNAPLTDAEKAMAAELRNWNAAQVLEDKAIASSGKITPATLVLAYGALQDSLHAERLTAPADALLAAKMSKLQQTFVYHVQELDYVEANQKRGVDIAAVEPALQAKAKKEVRKP